MNDETTKKNESNGEESAEYQQFEKGEEEPDSGVINFEQLTARASSPGEQPLAASSSIIPRGMRRRGRDQTPLEIAVTDVPLPVYTKKRNAGIYVVFSLFIVAVMGGALAFYLVQRDKASDSKSEELKLIAEIRAELEKSKTPKEAVARPAAPSESAVAVPASVELEPAAEPEQEPEAEVAEELEEQEEGEEDVDEAPQAKPAAPKTWKNKVSSHSAGVKTVGAKAAEPEEEAKLDDSLFLDEKKAALENQEVAEDSPAPTEKKAAAGPVNDGLDDLLGLSGSKRKAEKPAEVKAEPVPEETKNTLSRQDVVAGMKPVLAKAGSCSQYASGKVKVRITVGQNGRVQQAKTLGEFAGTKVGQCVEIITKVAKFPEFQGAPVVINYPITIP